MATPESSKPVESSKDGSDRISSLPDSLLSQVLSLLPTENAVATSILSTRWKFLWTSITKLNIDEETTGIRLKNDEMRMTKFTQFVNRVLLLINPPCIQTFRLKCSLQLFDHYYLNLWISAIAPTVQKLDLSIFLMMEKPMELPLRHFRFNKLVMLKLEGNIDFNVPAQASPCFPCLQVLLVSSIGFAIPSDSSVSFPNLKILHLHLVKYGNEDSASKLLSSCPVLDTLVISVLGLWDQRVCFIICIPSLTSLTLSFCGITGDRARAYEIQIDKLDKLKFLSISIDALKVLCIKSTDFSPYFKNLKGLELEVRDYCEWFGVINILLESTDNLEVLVLKRWIHCECSHNSWWTEPLSVPKCLLSRVKTISFTEMMDDCPDELELVAYFLKNAKVLQRLKLGTQYYSSERKLQLIEKISMLPKGSQECLIASI